jgi:hypothetical protein
VLRGAPFDGVDTVNDKHGFIVNFGRATKHDAETVAHELTSMNSHR